MHNPSDSMSVAQTTGAEAIAQRRAELVERVRSQFEAKDLVRRAVDRFHAGRFDEALSLFQDALARGADGTTLTDYLADCHVFAGHYSDAAQALDRKAASKHRTVGDAVRHAYVLSAGGRTERAIDTLRGAVRRNSESAELHFHLGTLLSEIGEVEEAELRFAQVLSIDAGHVDAMVSLGLCYGVRQDIASAFTWLQRAQARRPGDARIGIMLTQAAKALYQKTAASGLSPILRTYDEAAQAADIEELARVIEADPDFVDAFLALSNTKVNEEVFAVLLRTLETALERQPEHAELHYHCGRVLDRLGRCDAAIIENERAVAIDPMFTRALIELGRLYRRTNRTTDAASRLEAAIMTGADYADVHFLLGKLYCDLGAIEKARRSFRRALSLNDRYEAAREALELLFA